MTKQIFTKTQAISVLEQAKSSKGVDLFSPVKKDHAFYKLSCDELEKKLMQYISKDEIAGVVEDTIVKNEVSL